MLAWIGIALTAMGMIFSSYEFVKKNPEIMPKVQNVQLLAHRQRQSAFMYSQVNLAYDVANGKHWFQHPDGQWREFPPKPSQVDMQNSR
jgi:hypothetical protein